GVVVRPVVDMTGDHSFNEVFLDRVRLPAENLVGQENGGWALAKVTLGNERISLSGEGSLWGQGPTASDLLELVRRAGGLADPALRQELAKVWGEGEVLRLIRLRAVGAALSGRVAGAEASVRKALADEHGQRVMELAMRLTGARAMLAGAGPLPASGEGRSWPEATWSKGYLFSRALTIGGGTAEVQRNIVAERVLGLPHDVDVEAGCRWSGSHADAARGGNGQ
ncbi:MAG TPA: acyl-CoA dehydrogenase family protein, partial [Acidimicrobiales bacterium]|nr:acyl-CoA dehydrogenase family protein [Acidimicrobiales bacterium]